MAGPEGTAGPAAAAAAAAAQPGGGALAHFTLAVPSTEAVLQGLRASGQGGLIVEECAAVIPVRHHGHSWTVSLVPLPPALFGVPREDREAGCAGSCLPSHTMPPAPHPTHPPRAPQDRTSIVRDPSGYVWQLMEVHSGKVGWHCRQSTMS